MNITSAQRKFLRGRAHALQPVVLVGQAGLTAAVVAEVERALFDHELIKIRFRPGTHEARDQAIESLCTELGAACAGRIGNVAVLYRRNPERARITLPG
ncbi:MAG: ribosome assembly RNA-binding protein YhbY [Gammaproteobacteria bacterium]|nr:ribosome assembly RNA-binding protein YhbY [Gammaproteobacteria bacterium]